MNAGNGRDLRPSIIEDRLRAGLRAEAERCAAAEPARLAAACAAIPRATAPVPWNARRSVWIAAAAAVAALWVLTTRIVTPTTAPVPLEPVVRVATAADLARLHAARPHMPAVARPAARPRLVAVRPPPPVGSVPP